MKVQSPRYLVLGGSKGIGFEFARIRAPRKAEFVVVARHIRSLEKACDQLRIDGAMEARAVLLDLLETTDRRQFFRSLYDGLGFDGIFVGGPSPPHGHIENVTPKMVATAYEAAVQYPLDALKLARETLRRNGTVTILSSSASTEPLYRHEFFLSASMRLILDKLVDELRPIMTTEKHDLIMWKPLVVLTDLSMSFAEKYGNVKSDTEAIEWLKLRHGVSEIPTAMEYVGKMEKSLHAETHRAFT